MWRSWPPALGRECKIAEATLKNSLMFPQNMIVQLSSYPTVPLPGIDLREPEIYVHSENLCPNVRSNIIPHSQNYRQAKYPATNEWMNKMW